MAGTLLVYVRGRWQGPDAVYYTHLDVYKRQVSYTGGQEVFDTWTPDLLAPLTPLYVSPDGTSLGVGTWAVGSGSFSYLAWDWFNGGGATMADWDLVLQSLVPTVAAAPALGATGLSLIPL